VLFKIALTCTRINKALESGQNYLAYLDTKKTPGYCEPLETYFSKYYSDMFTHNCRKLANLPSFYETIDTA